MSITQRQLMDFDLRLGVGLSILLLCALDLSPDNVFPDIVLLAQVEELSDLRGSLRTQAFGLHGVSESWDLGVALLNDDQREDGDIGTDYATTDGFTLAFTSSADAVAGMAVGEEETDTVGKENTLLHWETLLVVTASDAENVALPFIANSVGCDFLRDLLVVENATVH